MLQESILQHFRPSLSYHLSLRPSFCLFLSGRFKTEFTVFENLDVTKGATISIKAGFTVFENLDVTKVATISIAT